MRIMIIGNHLATYVRAGIMDEGKSFYERKNEDVYYTPVEGRKRVTIIDEDGNRTMDEMMIYSEGDIIPIDPVPYPEFYEQDVILAHMQEHKIMSPHGLLAGNPTWSGVKQLGKWVYAYFPLILAGGVLVYAFL